MSQSLQGIHQNVHIVSDTKTYSQAAYVNKQFSQVIIEDVPMSLSIDKGHVDLNLPVFTFDSSLNAYSVQIEYGGVYSDVTPVVFIPQTPDVSITDPTYYYVWSIPLFIYMVNDAIAAAFINLSGKVIMPLGSTPPYFSFNGTNITAYAQVGFYAMPSAVRINMYMNTNLWKFFNGFPVIQYNGINTLASATQRDVRFLFFNTGNNTATISAVQYYIMTPDNPTEMISSWYQAVGIYIVSNSLKTRNELMPNVNSQFSASPFNLPVIYHYNFRYAGERPLFVDFITLGTYKLIDINKSYINNIDIAVYWFDKHGNSYPVTLLPLDAFNISLTFQEKI